jgi:hypothetical protein
MQVEKQVAIASHKRAAQLIRIIAVLATLVRDKIGHDATVDMFANAYRIAGPGRS